MFRTQTQRYIDFLRTSWFECSAISCYSASLVYQGRAGGACIAQLLRCVASEVVCSARSRGSFCWSIGGMQAASFSSCSVLLALFLRGSGAIEMIFYSCW